MADLRLFSSASNLIRFALKSSSTGMGLTGLTNASSGLIISTIADVESSATAYTVAGATIDTIATLGTYAAPTAGHCRFREVDSTNHKGLYEFQFADARFAVSNAKRLVISVTGAASLLDADYEIELVQFNPFDAVRLGLTALPNVASGNAGALLVDGTGTAAISNSGGKVLLQATQAGVTIPTVTTVTNQLTAAQIATGVWQDATAGDFTAASSIGKSLFTSGNAPGATGGLALVGSNVGTATSVSGSVGSVTGNVGGSVVGDVQGKVLGGGASAITGVGAQADVEQWKGNGVPATNVNGVPIVDVKYSSGTQIFNSDGTLASATATTVTFPAADSAGNTIPDDGRYAYTVIEIEAGTGVGQVVALTSKNGVRTFNILSGTCPVQLDATSKYVVLGSWRSELELWEGVAPNALISGRVDSNTQATASSLSFNLTGNITGNLTGSVGSVTGSVNSVTTTVASNVIQWSGAAVAGSIPPDAVFLRSGTAQAGGASTITLDAGASSVNNFYQNAVVFIRANTGAGQCALITTYVGATKVATINGIWATNPDATSVFSLLPFGAISASVAGNVTVGGYAAGQDPATSVWDALRSAHTVANSFGAGVIVATNNDKTGYSLSQAFPANFSSLSIDTNGRVQLQSGITKNTALNNFEFLMVLSDNITPAPGLTVTAKRSLDSGTFASCANAVTEVGNGVYSINLAASDLNANNVTLLFTATGAAARYITLLTTP